MYHEGSLVFSVDLYFFATTSQPDSEIVGMADIHNHMLSKEGFGGNFFKGDIVDLNDLDKDINYVIVVDESHGFLSFLKKPFKDFCPQPN